MSTAASALRPAHSLAAFRALALALAAVFSLCTLAHATLPTSSLQLGQASYSAGQDIVLTIAGTPGDIPVLFASLDPGPTTLPGIGQIDVGLGPGSILLVLPPIPAAGKFTITCPTDCDFSIINLPVFLQVVNFNYDTKKPSALSNAAVLLLLPGDCGDCAQEATADPAFNGSGHHHAFYLPPLGTDFEFVEGGTWVEHSDSTARLTGVIARASDPDQRFVVDIGFAALVAPGQAAYPPPGSPKLELDAAAYAQSGGPVNPGTWHYYLVTEGTLTGLADFAGGKLHVSRTGPAFQVGAGANGKNALFGGSGWLDVFLVHQPSDPAHAFPPIAQSDINIDIDAPCSRCPEADGGHVIWLPGIGTDFEWTTHGTYHEDGDTATLEGDVRLPSDHSKGFHLFVLMTDLVSPSDADFPPPGSPKKELDASKYADLGGPVDPATWHYYLNTQGTLTGLDAWAGAELSLVRFGPAFQVGFGASGKSLHFGASGWLEVDIAQQPSNGPALTLDGPHGDINITLTDCD